MTDAIALTGIRAFGRHGANPGEKDVPQPFDIALSLDVDLADARRSDALADTIDYAALHARIVHIVGSTSYDLLERLGQHILDDVFADTRIAGAELRIGKPQLLAGATPSVLLRQAR
jgi:dihydroneopterin aldolase